MKRHSAQFIFKLFLSIGLILTGFISGGYINTCSAQPAFITDSLDNYVEREMKRWNVPGAAVAIVKDGKLVTMKGYGVRDIADSTKKVNENTLFQIASNTKAFTATSLALLDYQKRLSLEDKVTKWLPYFKLYDPLATQEATVRDLLCHRIGYETFQSDLLNWNSNLSRKDLIMNMRNVKPVYGFRAHFGYCNVAFLTAGMIIKAVTDTSWDDFVKYHFFIPLKMHHSSTTNQTLTTDSNVCKPYTIAEGKMDLLPYANVDNLGPAAGINSCVKDLANWLMMQLDSGRFENKQIVPFKVLQMTRKSNTIVTDLNSKTGSNFMTYGLGWFMLDYHGHRIIQHDGGADGFVTTTCFIPDLNLGITVLTNTDVNEFYSSLRKQIIDAYIGLPYINHSEKNYAVNSEYVKKQDDEIKQMRETVERTPKPARNLGQYVGFYHNPVYGDIEVQFLSKIYLTLVFSHHPFLKGKLEPMGGTNFLCTYNIPTYGTKKGHFVFKDGKVTGIVIRVNDFVDTMPYEFVKQ